MGGGGVNPFFGELVGTAILVLLGDGVVANVVLRQTKGHASGWIVITTGWALAVFVGVYSVALISGAHLNPAISVGLATAGHFAWSKVPVYIAAQLIGAFVGAVLVWLAYLPHWHRTNDPETKLAVFATAPAIRSAPANFLCEVIGTFMLMFGVFLIKGAALDPDTHHSVPIDLGAIGALPVAFLVWAIGLSLGGPTGYAINPARDLGPRCAHYVLPIPGKGVSDWGYAWIPVAGPLVGTLLAALTFIWMEAF